MRDCGGNEKAVPLHCFLKEGLLNCTQSCCGGSEATKTITWYSPLQTAQNRPRKAQVSRRRQLAMRIVCRDRQPT